MHTTRNKRLFIVLMGIALLLTGLRLTLPTLLRNQLNQILADLGEYRGTVQQVEVHLWRGAYEIHHLMITKKKESPSASLNLSIPSLQFSILWTPILRLHIVGSAQLYKPKLTFTDSKESKDSRIEELGHSTPSPSDISKTAPNWQETIKKMFPLQIDHFEIIDGSLHFQNLLANPPIDVFLQKFEMTALNLTNSRDHEERLVSILRISALAMQDTRFELQGRFNGLEKDPLFDLNAKLESLNLTKLNNFFRHYGRFDFSQGTVEIVAEVASRHRNLKGYVKPLFKNIEVASWNQDVVTDRDDPLTLVWENTIGAVLKIFRHQKKRQLATIIPIEGTIDDTETNVYLVVANVMKNAFVKAFTSNFEETINANSVN